jgi:prolyl oligopeptidase PreP (S9A serine peptidase family)
MFHNTLVAAVWIWEQTAIISLYSINWLVFITETECVYCAVRTECLYIIQTICTNSLTFTNSTFCPHSIFVCFVWITEQVAIISLCSTDWLVFYNRDGVCLLRGSSRVFKHVSGPFKRLVAAFSKSGFDPVSVHVWDTRWTKRNSDKVFSCHYHSTNSSIRSLFARLSYQKVETAEDWELSPKRYPLKNPVVWIDQVLSLSV